MKNVFVDSDVILDLLTGRKPFCNDAEILFSMAEKGSITIFVSSLIFSNIYSILRKLKGRKVAIESLRKLKMLVKILPVAEKTVDYALSSNFNDFEDAIQYYTASNNGIKHLITRNTKDYKNNQIEVFTPDEYIKLYYAIIKIK